MKTVFGVEWPVADTLEVTLILLFILMAGFFAVLIWYYLNLKKKQAQEQQYFLYKTKQLGLTAAQTKILNSIIVMISLRDLRRMLTESSLFESSIGSFFEYLNRKGETGESLLPVCRDIVITHEKIYHAATYRKPLDTIGEIEKNTLLYYHDNQNRCFIGKVTGAEEQSISLRLLHRDKDAPLPAGTGVDVCIWRTGDAEYTFKTLITEAADDTVKMKLPDTYSRGKEARHPYVDAMIPCEISFQTVSLEKTAEGEVPQMEDNKVSGMIYKLNEHEIVARVASEIDFKRDYLVTFQVADFNVKARSAVIADRTLHEENVHYYAFKFIEVSPVAQNILKTYVTERLA